jgi:hypothetical protein
MTAFSPGFQKNCAYFVKKGFTLSSIVDIITNVIKFMKREVESNVDQSIRNEPIKYLSIRPNWCTILI